MWIRTLVAVFCDRSVSHQRPLRDEFVVSFAQARAALRRLILIELDKHGEPDPVGLNGPGFTARQPM